MAIKRTNVKYDVRHGGTYNDSLQDKGVAFVDGNDPNHEQKIITDGSLMFYREGEEPDEDSTPILKVFGDEYIDRDAEIGRDVHVHQDAAVDGNTLLTGRETEEGTPALTVIGQTDHQGDVLNEKDVTTEGNVTIIGNVDDDGEPLGYALDVTHKAHFNSDVNIDGPTTINNTLAVNGTATITGDLHVKGTSYEEHATDLYVGADFITLRESNNTAIGNYGVAGTIINNYDGEDSLGIVTGNDGILRIGEIAIEKVYTTDDTTYYSDRELTTEVTLPDDAHLNQIGETDPDTGLKEYYYISKDDTEPVATRGTNDSMKDQYLTKWNSSGLDIVTTAVTEEEAIDAVVNGRNIAARVDDVEHGNINLDATSKYPVAIEVNDATEKVQYDGSLLTFTTTELIEGIPNSDGTIPYIPCKDFYVDDTVVGGFRKHGDDWEYSFDGTEFITFDDPTIFYYETGAKESVNYNFSLTSDNVIRYFDTVQAFEDEKAATLAGESDNPLEPDNIVMIRNAVASTTDTPTNFSNVGAPLTVVDTIAAGDYNAVTSNAVSKLLGGEIATHIDNVTIKLKDPTYTLTGLTALNAFRTWYDESTGLPLDALQVLYKQDGDVYWPISSAEKTVTDGTTYITWHWSEDEGVTIESLTETGVIDSTVMKRTSTGVLYVDEEQCFLMAHPIGSCLLATSAPTYGTWTDLGTLNGAAQSSVKIYERTA